MLLSRHFSRSKTYSPYLATIKQAKANMSWPPEMLAMVLASKKACLEKQGVTFNYFILERHDDNDQFLKFLTELKSKLHDIPTGTILSVAVRAGTHWTALHIKIVNGQCQVFCMDARFHPVADRHVMDLKQQFEDALIFKFEPDRVLNPKTGDRELRRIQISDIGCGIFTLDHLMCLHSTDMLPGLIHDKEAGTIKFLESYGFYAIKPDQFVGKRARLIRTTQVRAYLETLTDSVKQTPVAHNESLIQFVCRHQAKTPSAYGYDNTAINQQQIYFCKLAQTFVLSSSKQVIDSVIQNRQGFHRLAQIAQTNPQLHH